MCMDVALGQIRVGIVCLLPTSLTGFFKNLTTNENFRRE